MPRVCSVSFLYNDIPLIYYVYPFDMHVYQRYIIIKKGTEKNHEVFTGYIPDILVRFAYNLNIPCIYHVYNMNTIYIYT